MTAPPTVRRIWTSGLASLGSHPSIYLPFGRWRYGADLTFGPQTEIVIEGFPRSANSFAVNAFMLAQRRPVRVAHHLHAPAQVMAAARAGVPAVVLVRAPRDAIVSYLRWQPHVGVRQAARNYLSFYRSVAQHHEHFVAADFEQVTSDFGAVIRRVNARFGSAFVEFDHSEENVRLCFDAIERQSRAQRGDLLETVVARPSAERRALKAKAELEFTSNTPAATREALEAVYVEYQALTGG